jgi:hypothetical protein
MAIIYVKSGSTGNGSAWNNAYGSLQSAITAAQAGDEIWVAAGTYKPTTGTDRTASFTLKNNVAIYGGFAGTETALNQRNIANNITILSGEIGAAGIADNSYHVISATGNVSNPLTNSAILDGFTVVGGNANGTTGNQGNGGGVYVSGASPTLKNITFRDNSGVNGGAVFSNLSNSNFIKKFSIATFILLLGYFNVQLPANAQRTMAACGKEPSLSKPATETREIRLDDYGLAFKIPANYRALKNNATTISIYNPSLYKYIQCLRQASDFHWDGSFYESAEISINPLNYEWTYCSISEIRNLQNQFSGAYTFLYSMKIAGKNAILYRQTTIDDYIIVCLPSFDKKHKIAINMHNKLEKYGDYGGILNINKIFDRKITEGILASFIFTKSPTPFPVGQPGSLKYYEIRQNEGKNKSDPKVELGNLDYYKFREEDFRRRNPNQKAPDYYLGFGDKYLRIFMTETYQKLTPNGQQFLKNVGKKLQEKIEDKLKSDPQGFSKLELDSKAFKKFAYGTHPDAYCEAGWGDLPKSDRDKIIRAVDRKDLYFSSEGLNTGLEMAGKCAPLYRDILDVITP